MNVSTQPLRLRFVSKVMTVAVSVLTILTLLVVNTGAIQAQKRKPTPTPTPISGVAAPSSIQIILVRPDSIQLLINPSSALNEAQLISGPNSAGRAIVTNFTNVVTFSGLIANSDYVFRVRNIQTRLPLVASPWVNFSFHTATDFATRPNPPQNLRVVAPPDATDTRIYVTWDAPSTPGSFSYQYSLNGVYQGYTGSTCSPYCSDIDLRTVIFARPAAGSSVLFSVTATDVNFNTSLPAELVVNN